MDHVGSAQVWSKHQQKNGESIKLFFFLNNNNKNTFKFNFNSPHMMHFAIQTTSVWAVFMITIYT